MKKIVFLLAGILVFMASVKSQTNEDRIDKLRNVIPPSPNASSLGKYSEWPVNLYTGLPNIDIPIYELKGRSLSVPVSISYHAAGNKVGEIASWVGLGWSLNAGGMISRSVRGYPDEDPYNGYFVKRQLYVNQNDLCSNPVDATLAKRHKVSTAKCESDAEQDIYSFNAQGRSFKFFFRADGTIEPTPYSKVKITTNFGPNVTVPENVSWIAFFEDGTKLEFGGANFMEVTNNTRFDIGSTYFTTAWMLKKITSVDGEEINFSYAVSTANQDSYCSQSDFIQFNLGTVDNSLGNGCPDYAESYMTRTRIEKQDVTMRQVASIESELCRVEFEESTSLREDLLGGKALNAIKVFSKRDNAYILRYKFNYNYSQAIASNTPGSNSYYEKRLKLITLEKTDINTSLENKWQFNYNTQNLPSRYSYAQDHWGFYNGKIDNTTLLPKFFYSLSQGLMQGGNNNTGFNAPHHEIGANREGDANFAKAEILESIIYPTGGKTNFYYEGNTIPVSEEQFTNANASIALNLNSLSNPYTNFSQTTFTISTGQNVSLSFNSYITQGIFNDMPNAHVNVYVSKAGGINSGSISNPTGVSTYNGAINFNLSDPGTYTMRIETNVDQSSFGNTDAIIGYCSISYQQSLGFQTINKNTGGLRLSRMTINDAINAANNSDRYYIYENPLIANPIDVKKLYFTELEQRTGQSRTDVVDNVEITRYTVCDNKIITRNSSTKYSLGDVQGGTVGYGKVSTLYGLNGINGKTVTEFTNDQDFGISESEIFPFPPVDPRPWRRGAVLKETDYNAQNLKIKEVSKTYLYEYVLPIANFKAGFYKTYSLDNGSIAGGFGCNDLEGDCNIQKICYNTTSEYVKSISSTNIQYDINGLNPFTTTSTNYYDNPNNLQPVRIETIDSKGQLIKSINRTPLEKTDINVATPLTTAQLAAIDDLVSRNILSTVLQSEQYKSGNLLSRSLITYKNFGGLILKPETIQKQKGNNPLETDVTFNAYDNLGNLLEQQKTNDVKQSYLYGYNKNYPVAQVVGAGSAAIAALVNQSVLDNPLSTDQQIRNELNNLRTGLAGTNALITTYTYKPLVGVTSVTDANSKTTYYEYDRFNRLVIIKDKDNNVLKKICYNYAGQPENCTICTNLAPNWQNTTTALRCQQGSCGNTGYQEQEQKDINPCSATYNQTQWVVAGYNPSACAPQSCATITSTNNTGFSGYVASYYNVNTGYTYTFNVSATGGLQTLGSLPEGTYNLTLSRPVGPASSIFKSGCKFQVITGTLAIFYNVPVSVSGGCKSITIDPDQSI